MGPYRSEFSAFMNRNHSINAMAFQPENRLAISAECRRLANGRYKGVVVRSIIGRFSADDFQVECVNERDSKEEAMRDARDLACK